MESKRNKVIISCLLLLSAALCIWFIVSDGELHFENLTKELIVAQVTKNGILLFIFEWAALTVMYGTCFWTLLFCITILIYWALHREDKRILDRRYHPACENELFFGGYLSAAMGYLFTSALVLLKHLGVLIVDFF